MGRRYGKIINISSIAARRDAQILRDYTASKNTVLSLTRVTAEDLAPYNVNVNAISYRTGSRAGNTPISS